MVGNGDSIRAINEKGPLFLRAFFIYDCLADREARRRRADVVRVYHRETREVLCGSDD